MEENIVSLVSAYKDLYMENKTIHHEINLFKKKFNPRIKEIKKKMASLEKDLLRFMNDNNHPGIRFQDIILLPSTKSQRSKKNVSDSSLQHVQSVLHKYNVSPQIKQDLLDILNPPSLPPNDQIIKVKLWNQNIHSMEN